MSSTKVTRGYGFLENFLANQRMKRAHKIIKETKKNGKILDIGCGSYPLFLINSNFVEKYGIDQGINSFEINHLNLILKNLLIINNSKLPFDRNYFDVITMLAVIEHLNNDQIISILKECYSILKKDGILIITTPAKWSNFLLKILARLRLVSIEEVKEHKHAYTLKKLNNLLLKSNFEHEKIKKGYFECYMNLWLIARK